MRDNIIAELLGIVVTVLVVERYLSWWENRQKRAARQLVVSSIGKRLDQLAFDWGWVLNFLTLIGTGKGIEQVSKLFDSIPERLNPILPSSVRGELASDVHAAALNSQTILAKSSTEKMLALKLEHIVSRLEDVLNAVDGAAIVVSSSMLDLVVELRETLLTNIRGITDFRDLLANPTPEQASNVFGGAIAASLSCEVYRDLILRLWQAIPAHDGSGAPELVYLRAVLSQDEQAKFVRDFLYLSFPEYDPSEIIRRAEAARRLSKT